MKYYRCGKILTTHGLKGDLKVTVTSDFDRFQKGNQVYIKHEDEYILVTVNKVSDFGKYLLVNFNNYEDINLVQKFHSDEIYVSEEMRVDELDEDEYYFSDLIGLEVFNENNQSRGKVVDIKELPQCDYLYVAYKGKNHYIPFIDEFILEVSDKIIIKEKEGLFNED